MNHPLRPAVTAVAALIACLLLLFTAVRAHADPQGPRPMRMALNHGDKTNRELCTDHQGWMALTLTAANRTDPYLRVRQTGIEGGSVPLGSFRRVGDQIDIGLVAARTCVYVVFKNVGRHGAFTVLMSVDY